MSAGDELPPEALHEAARLLGLKAGRAECSNCRHLTATGELTHGWCERAGRPNRLIALCRHWEPRLEP